MTEMLIADEGTVNRGGRTAVLRPCERLEELDDCVRLQGDVWGYADGDIIPRRVFVVARHIGGQVFGAFEEQSSRMIGFAMALPAVKRGGQSYLHSHMLAVDPDWRNAGIGQQLKWYQREEAVRRGITHMEWTFDPLEIKNAFLNIHRLGAIVRTYLSDFYGVSSSRLQKDLPTDRLIAEWHLTSGRVEAARTASFAPQPDPARTITVPSEVAVWKSAGELDRAREVQQQLRSEFIRAFADGLAVTGFHRDAAGNGVYELAVGPN
jgi:predicted GNAT superfamily acetyltransferase